MSAADIDEDDEKWLMNVRSAGTAAYDAQLARAARDGNLWRVETLISYGANVNCNEGAAFVMAAGGGHMDVMHALLTQGVDFEISKQAALYEAIAHGQETALRFLISKGADPAYDDSIALFFAAQYDRPTIVQLLIDGGANVNGHDGKLLCLALSCKNENSARVLLDNGADPRNRRQGKNAFEWAADMGMSSFSKLLSARLETDVFMSAGFFKRFIPEQFGQETGDKAGHTVLHLAAQAGCFDILRDALLSSPAARLQSSDLLKSAPNGKTALFMLGETGQLPLVFDARLWEGRKAEMQNLFEKIPSAFRGQVDLQDACVALDHIALKKRAPALRLKRAPKPF